VKQLGPAIVDDEDYGYLSRYEWYPNTKGHVIRKTQEGVARLDLTAVMLAGALTESCQHFNWDRSDCRRANLIHRGAKHQPLPKAVERFKYVSQKRWNGQWVYRLFCVNNIYLVSVEDDYTAMAGRAQELMKYCKIRRERWARTGAPSRERSLFTNTCSIQLGGSVHVSVDYEHSPALIDHKWRLVDGVVRRVSDGKPMHDIVAWSAYRGMKIATGYRDGNPLNCRLENLILYDREYTTPQARVTAGHRSRMAKRLERCLI
jgi:hypothetical protein